MPRLNLDLTITVALTARQRRWLELAAEVAAPLLPKEARQAPLSLLVCGDARIRALNRTHRGKDKTTDVLSFPTQTSLRRNGPHDWAAPGILPLGDMVICLPQAARQSKRLGSSLEEELVHLFFHGFLHLVGYDHEVSVKEERIMEAGEAKLLAAFARARRKAGLK